MRGSESEELEEDLEGKEEEEDVFSVELGVIVGNQADDEGVGHDENVEEYAEDPMLFYTLVCNGKE